jgi:hypothetical protein
MELWGWLTHNWIDLLTAIGLFLTAYSLHSETKTRRVANLLILTQNHRELWSDFSDRPDLTRVLDASADITREPITRDEKIFVNTVILHIHASYQAMRNGLVIKPEGVRRDVSSLLNLPIFEIVWEETKVLQNDDFVVFVESCRNRE